MGNQEQANTSSFYTSIKKLPYNKFRDCSIDLDLTLLVIEGRPSIEELTEAWENIQQEFSSQIGGDIKDKLGKIYKAESLNSKINRLTNTLILFIEEPLDALVEVFKNEGWNYPTDDLYNYVQCIRNEIGSLQVKLEEQKSKLDKNTGGEELTYESYAELMAEIRKMEGWAIPDTITTLEFCIYYNRLVKHVESLKYGNRANR